MDTSYLAYVLASKGVNPNDHSSNAGSIIWTFSVLCIVVVLMTYARIRVRWHSITFGHDDWLIIGAALFTCLFAALSIDGARRGLGRHIFDILQERQDPKLEASQRIVETLMGANVSYNIAVALAKLSIIASYLRIIPNKTFRRTMWAVGIFTILLAISECVTIPLMCNPPESTWNWGIPRKYCIDIPAFFYSVSGINTATDFGLWVAPLWFFIKSQMPPKKKCELVALYIVGLAGCLFGFFRMGFLSGLASPDITFTGALSLNNSMAEVTLGIISANIPPLRPALRFFTPILEWFRPMLEWFRPMLGWLRPVLEWFRPVLKWFRPMLQWFQKPRGSPPVSKNTPANSPQVDGIQDFERKSSDTPASTPQVDDIQHFERRRTLSRVEGAGTFAHSNDIELSSLDKDENDDKEFDEGFRQYLGSWSRHTPSVTSTIRGRGSATSVNYMV